MNSIDKIIVLCGLASRTTGNMHETCPLSSSDIYFELHNVFVKLV